MCASPWFPDASKRISRPPAISVSFTSFASTFLSIPLRAESRIAREDFSFPARGAQPTESSPRSPGNSNSTVETFTPAVPCAALTCFAAIEGYWTATPHSANSYLLQALEGTFLRKARTNSDMRPRAVAGILHLCPHVVTDASLRLCARFSKASTFALPLRAVVKEPKPGRTDDWTSASEMFVPSVSIWAPLQLSAGCPATIEEIVN